MWTRHVLTAVAVAMLLASCGTDSPTPVSSLTPTTSTPAPATTSPSTAAGAGTALDAYRGMWRAYVEAIRIPDPHYPDLTRYAQGDALEVFVRGLTSVRRDGLVGKGDVTVRPKVTESRLAASPPTVNIDDCVDTSQSHLVKADGSAYKDTPGGRQSAKAIVSQVDATQWKVSSFALYAVGTC